MNNKPIISIAIPTWNRASSLKSLLVCILPQAKEANGLVEICVSNNSSPDNTREIVMSFQKKYPGLIKYNENEKNIGAHRNFLKVMEMSQGDFVWLLGDDDLVVDNGVKKVIDFIKNYCGINTGLINFALVCHFVDAKTGKKTVCSKTTEKNKPKAYKINREDVIGQSFPDATFISGLLYNNNFLKKILIEEKKIIEEALNAPDCAHTFLYRLMFLKYPELQALRFNEIIIDEDFHYYKLYVEDTFHLHYVAFKEIAGLLLSSKYINDYYREIIANSTKNVTKGAIMEMGLMRAFNAFNYSSFFGCLKMFFRQATPADALLFSAFFIFFSITPSVILKNLYKTYAIIRQGKKWRKSWSFVIINYSEMSKGSRRRTD